MRSIGPAVTREQSPAFLRNSNGRLDPIIQSPSPWVGLWGLRIANSYPPILGVSRAMQLRVWSKKCPTALEKLSPTWGVKV